MTSLLPASATQLERDVESVTNTPVQYDLRNVWNVDTCPAELLPWLAWSLSVDVWDANWSDFTKRQVIRNSIRVHRVKGTLEAVESALEPFGALVTLTEWYEQTPPGAPYTFRLDVAVEGGLSGELANSIVEAVDQAKPVSRTYTLNAAVMCNATGYLGTDVFVYGYEHSRVEAAN